MFRKMFGDNLSTITLPGRSDAKAKFDEVSVVHISDTHNELGSMVDSGEVPDGDILIHSGDFTNKGLEWEVRQFLADVGRLPHKNKVIICGNHEMAFRCFQTIGMQNSLEGLTYLQDSSTTIQGIKIYGSPWNDHSIGAFGAVEDQRREKFRAIPWDVDVLVTHQPPMGPFDLAYVKKKPLEFWKNVQAQSASTGVCTVCHDRHRAEGGVAWVHWGCPALSKAIQERSIPLHLSGHAHDFVGRCRFPGGPTVYCNSAMQAQRKAHKFTLRVPRERGMGAERPPEQLPRQLGSIGAFQGVSPPMDYLASIVNVDSGLVLDVDRSNNQAGAQILCWTARRNAGNQRFRFVPQLKGPVARKLAGLGLPFQALPAFVILYTEAGAVLGTNDQGTGLTTQEFRPECPKQLFGYDPAHKALFSFSNIDNADENDAFPFPLLYSHPGKDAKGPAILRQVAAKAWEAGGEGPAQWNIIPKLHDPAN